jgi:hypothetical protein
VLELEVELVVVVRVEVTRVVVEVDVVITAAEEDVLVGPAVVLSVPGMHWSVDLSASIICASRIGVTHGTSHCTSCT